MRKLSSIFVVITLFNRWLSKALRIFSVQILILFLLSSAIVGIDDTWSSIPSLIPLGNDTDSAESTLPPDADPLTPVDLQTPTVIRQRKVMVNLNVLEVRDSSESTDGDLKENRSRQQKLILSLFDDVNLPITIERQALLRDGGASWIGSIDDVNWSSATLIARDGTVTANIRSPIAFYTIRPLAEGVHLVREIDTSHVQHNKHDGREIPAVDTGDPKTQNTIVASNAVGEGQVEATAATTNAVATDDGSIIDIMIAYTTAARAAAGGTQAIRDRIDLVIAETNLAYANSQINTRLRLAHAYEVDYRTSGSHSLDLDRVTFTNDGFLEDVHTIRDIYGADLVSLWVEGGDFCGIAWIRSTAPFAFSVVDRWCAENTVTFPHELGHNFGARHDWYVDDYRDNPSYNKGFVNVLKRWYTVMSYNNQCSDAGIFCQEILYFSNPNVFYEGAATGVPAGTSTACTAYNRNNPLCDAENFRIHNARAPFVAQFRQSVETVDLALTKIDLVDPVNAGDEITYRLTVRNGGIEAATDVVVTDTLPQGVQFVRTSNPTVCSYSNRTVICQLGTLAGRGVNTFDLVVQTSADTPARIFNNATVTTSSAESSTINNTDSEGTRIHATGTTNPAIFISSTSNGWIGTTPFRDEDIVAYDETTGQWSFILDGSDIGIRTDINGFTWLADGSLLLTVDRPTRIAGIGTVDDSDILHFIPESLGLTTAGTLTLYFDGSKVGLTTNGEDIDAIALSPEGDLIVSTLGNARIDSIRAKDEDLLRFRATMLGQGTSGTWESYLDGSTLGLTTRKEDVFGTWIDTNSGAIYLTMAGTFAVTGVAGNGSDIILCTPTAPGNPNTCQFSTFWLGIEHQFQREVVDGFALGTVPDSLAVQASGIQAIDLEPIEAIETVDDDLDDTDVDEQFLFLPFVRR